MRRSWPARVGMMLTVLAPLDALYHWIFRVPAWPHQTELQSRADLTAGAGMLLGAICVGAALMISGFRDGKSPSE